MPRVTQKGQVTIPRQIRSILGIDTGDEVIFEITGNGIFLVKRKSSIKNCKKYIGFLSHLSGSKTDDIIAEMRGDADDFSR